MQVAAAALPDRHHRVVVAADRVQRQHPVGRRRQPVPERSLVYPVAALHIRIIRCHSCAAGIDQRVERNAADGCRRIVVVVGWRGREGDREIGRVGDSGNSRVRIVGILFPCFPSFPFLLFIPRPQHFHKAEILVAIAAAAQAKVVAVELAGELRVGQIKGRFQPFTAIGLVHHPGALEVVAGCVVL